MILCDSTPSFPLSGLNLLVNKGERNTVLFLLITFVVSDGHLQVILCPETQRLLFIRQVGELEDDNYANSVEDEEQGSSLSMQLSPSLQEGESTPVSPP